MDVRSPDDIGWGGRVAEDRGLLETGGKGGKKNAKMDTESEPWRHECGMSRLEGACAKEAGGGGVSVSGGGKTWARQDDCI